jgi:hypothetical protein
MNLHHNLRRNRKGIGTVFGMVFFLLIVMVVFASFVIILNQNTGLEQTTIQAKQLDLDRYIELTTVFITNPQIAVSNSQVYISCTITNTGTLPTELVRLWIRDNTTDTFGNTKISPSIILQPGSSTQYFNFSYIVNSHPVDLFSFWFITSRGNTISAYPNTNQLNIIPPVGTFPGVTDMNSTYQTNQNNPLSLSINTTKPNQLIYVVVSFDDGNTLYTPTSTPSLTWTLRGTSLPTDGSGSWPTYGHSGDSILTTFYAIAPSAGHVTINIHSTADELSDYYCSALAFAISDVNTTSPFDGSAQTTIGQSSMPLDTITTHYSNDLIIGALGIDDLNPAITPGAGFGQIMPVQSSFGASGEPNSMPRSVWSEWAIAGDPRTNLSANCTFAFSEDWAIIVDAVKLVIVPPVTPVSVSPNSGPIGQSVTVSGQGFAANSPLIALFDGSQIPFSATTDSSGKIPSNAKFTVPIGSTAGNKTVTIVDSSFNYANTTFQVTTPNITVSPTSGPVGTNVTVTGSNFIDNSNITINFDGNSTVTNPSTVTANATGQFVATFNFNFNDSAGVKQVLASDGVNSASANFTVTPSITLSPTNGPIGSSVNVTGSGFVASQPVIVTFAGSTIQTIPVSFNTNGVGFFNASFTIPTGQTVGGKTVNATDASSNSAIATFTVTPSISLNPTIGNAGSTVTVSGSGFAGNSALTATFAGSTVTISGTTNTNSSGSFTGATFTVPASTPPNNQTVLITDASSNSGSATFWVNTLVQNITVTMSNSAPSGNVTVNGGYPSPSTFQANGASQSITMVAGAPFTLSFSNSGVTRDGFIVSSAFFATSSSYTASFNSISVTAYEQVQNTFSVSGVSGGDSVALTGTYLGAGSSTIVTLNSGNSWSASAWSDYNTAVTFPVSTANSGSSERWSIGNAYTTAVLTAGGNTYSQTYIHQCKLTFAQSGLDTSATGTVVTVNSAAQIYSNLPYTTGWINSGSTVTYSYNNPVTSSTAGKQFRLNSVTGSASPITVSSPATITGNYVAQWQVSFSQTGVDSSAGSNTVLTVGSTNYVYNALPSSVWVDSGTTFSWVSTVSGGTGKQFVLTGSSGASPITAAGAYSATYKTQYYQTVTSSPATGSGYITVDGVAKATPYQAWWDSGSSHTIAANSPVTIVSGQSQYVYSSWSDSGAQSHSVSPTAVTTYTVSFQLQYYFSVSSARDSPTGQGWYNAGSSVSSTVTRPVSGGTGIQYETTGWTGTGSLSSGGSAGSSSTGSFTINAYSTCTWNWKTQYQVSFSQTGVDSSAGSNTVLTVGSTNYVYNALPSSVWVDSGTTFSWVSTVSGGTGKQFVLTGSSGASPITAAGAYSATYKTVAIAKIGTDTSATGTGLTLSWSHTLVAGSNRLVVVCLGAEHNGITVSGVTYGGNAMTLAVSYESPASGTKYLSQIWYILGANLPANGATTVTVTATGDTTSLEVNAFCSEYTGVTQAAPEATNGVSQTSGNTITNTFSPSANAWVISAMGSGNTETASWTHGSQVGVFDFNDASSCFAVAELRGASGQTSLASTYSGTVNRLVRVCASFQMAP